jgi:hypothetical protein
LLEGEQADFQALPWSMVTDRSPAALDALREEPRALSSGDGSHPWADPGFRFQFSNVGLARLKEEQAALEALGFTVTVRSRSRDQRLFFEMARGGAGERAEQYLCIFPVEFPFGPPRLLVLPSGEDLPLPRAGWAWNSDRRVADLLADRPCPGGALDRPVETARLAPPDSAPGGAAGPAAEAPVATRPAPASRQITGPRSLHPNWLPVAVLGWLAAALLVLRLWAPARRNRKWME